MVMISKAAVFAALLSGVTSPGQAQLTIERNYLDGCVPSDKLDASLDYFPDKYLPPSIFTYEQRTDIYGNQFVPHNTTDLLEIHYHGTYKVIKNKHHDESYLLYQCGTEPPQDEIDSGKHHLVLPVPHTGGLAITQTVQIPPLELLGLRDQIIAYIGDPQYISSPCLLHMLDEGDIEVVFNPEDPFNGTINAAMQADFLDRNPDAIIFRGPTDPPGQERTINTASSQEMTNVATFDWIALYAALFNMEAFSNKITRETQARYDCSSTNARFIANQQQSQSRRQLEQTHIHESKSADEIQILWAVHFTGYNWSVAQCPTWDSAYYCEFATHCGTNIISRPQDMGYSVNFGGATDYWYINDEEFASLGKDADVWIFPSNRWDQVYEEKKEFLDQFQAVQNKLVFDNQGSGSNAWFEQRLAEFDVVGLDLCDIVGTVNPNGPPHKRRWFRNVFSEPIGELPACNVPEELSQPYQPQGAECELITMQDDDPSSSQSGVAVAKIQSGTALVLLAASLMASLL